MAEKTKTTRKPWKEGADDLNSLGGTLAIIVIAVAIYAFTAAAVEQQPCAGAACAEPTATTLNSTKPRSFSPL